MTGSASPEANNTRKALSNQSANVGATSVSRRGANVPVPFQRPRSRGAAAAKLQAGSARLRQRLTCKAGAKQRQSGQQQCVGPSQPRRTARSVDLDIAPRLPGPRADPPGIVAAEQLRRIDCQVAELLVARIDF